MKKPKTKLIHPQQAKNALAWLLSDSDAATKITCAIANLRAYEFDEEKPLCAKGLETVHCTHLLTDNSGEAEHEGSAVVAIDCDKNWSSLSIHDAKGVVIADATIELYEGKLIGRMWNAADCGGDPTAHVELCDNPNANFDDDIPEIETNLDPTDKNP